MKTYLTVNWYTQSIQVYPDSDMIIEELKHTPLDGLTIYEVDTSQGFLYAKQKICSLGLKDEEIPF